MQSVVKELSKSTVVENGALFDTAAQAEHFVTSFDNNFLPIGMCLHSSLLKHAHPFHLWILCMDELVEQNLRHLALPHVSLIPLRDAEDARLLAVKPTRSRGEYCWTLTPFTAQFVFDRDPQVKRVTYIDADLFFFVSPKLLLDEFERSGKHVLITEHAYGPRYEYSGRAKRGGRFCVQFMTFRRTHEGEKIMHWWQDRCLEWCYARVEDGKFGDQKYLDLWPELFGRDVHILQQKEKTLAPWNVEHFAKLGGGKLNPVFYHFQTLRIISADEILLYSGWKVGQVSAGIYHAYMDSLRSVVSRMLQERIPVAYLPRRKGLVGRLTTLKHKYIDGEKSVPLQSGMIESVESPSALTMPVVTGKAEGGRRIFGYAKKQSIAEQPLVSIVTVVYNGATTLEHTIQSIIEQVYGNVEHIIVDGGSTDGTLDILRKYDADIAYWVSEKDAGIYDAMNKGIALAKGDYIGMLNADDYLASPLSLETIISQFKSNDVDAVFSNLDIVDPENLNRVLRKYRVPSFSSFLLRIGVMPPHPTFYCKKSCYEKVGLYRTDYRIAADFEMLVRMLQKFHISWSYIDKTTVKMRSGGVSSSGIKSSWVVNREIIRACLENGLYTNIFFLMLKLPIRLLERVL
jgi:hypothetical protein